MVWKEQTTIEIDYTNKIVMQVEFATFKFSVLRNTIVQHLQDSKSSYNIYKRISNIKYYLK